MKTRLMLVRHGATTFNQQHRLTGATDAPLSDEGREQMRLLRELLAPYPFDIALTSPLQRATESCEILLDGSDIPMIADETLRERDFGAWEGRSFQEIIDEQPDGGRSIMHGPFVAKFLSGETNDVFHTRVEAARLAILRQYAGRSVLVVGHAAFLMVFLALSLGLDPATNFATFRLDNASLTLLDDYEGVPHLLFANRVIHRP
ncbi:histidine phosphatase family protein [bacterium]|nr:histidine phosphatase family protein [bacterium]MCB9475337.1 histidine phosphatase family protein [Deltaproteobacteria bacterium]